MYRIEETSNVIKIINLFKEKKVSDSEIVKTVCSYFDLIKDDDLTFSDIRFLKYISNIVGVPHYYDLLKKINSKSPGIIDFDLITFSSCLYESTLYTNKDVKLHKNQSLIIDKFEKEKNNKYFLSASTSFGKTFLVYEIIRKIKYNNILLIFPTIALLSENLEKLYSDTIYDDINSEYKIHTLSEISEFGKKNIFIFTPERFLSFSDFNYQMKFDFAFIDEVYKMDNEYIIDEINKENERDVAYRIALYHILKHNSDLLLSGPYIEFSNKNEKNYNPSFDNFLKDNKIELIDYNNYEIVDKKFININKQQSIYKFEKIEINFSNIINKTDKYKFLTLKIVELNENVIVYCQAKHLVESYAEKLIDSELNYFSFKSNKELSELINHIKSEFKSDWIILKALEKGVGIHHGLVPKYLQKEIIDLFNRGIIKILLSTTTITEGINTTAKNIIILHDKKGKKSLKKFDAKNIAGRAGRFLKHFSGRVFAIDNNFMKIINSEKEIIKHKNYDIKAVKDEIDIFFTNEQYLNNDDKKNVEDINKEQIKRRIPDYIMNMYKVVSKKDKIFIYDKILKLDNEEKNKISNLIIKIHYKKMTIDLDGFQIIIDLLREIVKNEKLKFLILFKGKNNELKYSGITYLINYYLKDGIKGAIKYKIENKGKNIDAAIRDSFDFAYNILKYHLVKYLGVFNIMYKYEKSRLENKKFEDVSGIDKLLLKFEYNSISEKGRIASDYGVPSKIIEFYDTPDESLQIKKKFDSYENRIFTKINKIINKEL